jgi:hypothetical protein
MSDDAARPVGLSDGSSAVKNDTPAGKAQGRARPARNEAAEAALKARVADFAAKKGSTAKFGGGWRAAKAAKARGNEPAGQNAGNAAKPGPWKTSGVPAAHGAPQPDAPTVQGATDRLHNPFTPQSDFTRNWTAAHFGRPVATEPVYGNRGFDSIGVPALGLGTVAEWAMPSRNPPQSPSGKTQDAPAGAEVSTAAMLEAKARYAPAGLGGYDDYGRNYDLNGAKSVVQAGGGEVPKTVSAATGGGETHNNTSPYDLFGQWVTGKGPRDQQFTNGDPMLEELRRHAHMAGVRNGIRNEINTGRAFRDFGGMQAPYDRKVPYSLGHDWEGVRKFGADSGMAYGYALGVAGMTGAAALGLGGPANGPAMAEAASGLTGPFVGRAAARGNLAVLYVGSYKLTYKVVSINPTTREATVAFHAYNESTMASAIRPPGPGYTPSWQKGVDEPVNRAFPTGPFSKTTQSFDWIEIIKY